MRPVARRRALCYDRQADTAAAAAAHSAGKCLRRRGESVFTMKIVLKQDVKSIGKKDGVYEAVSYTHLDVYKRQLQGRVPQ